MQRVYKENEWGKVSKRIITYNYLFIVRIIVFTELQPGQQRQTATTSGMINRDSRRIICILSLWYVFFFFIPFLLYFQFTSMCSPPPLPPSATGAQDVSCLEPR